MFRSDINCIINSPLTAEVIISDAIKRRMHEEDINDVQAVTSHDYHPTILTAHAISEATRLQGPATFP